MSESALAKQTTLNDMSSKFGGRTPGMAIRLIVCGVNCCIFCVLVRIHFLDNSSKMMLLDQNQMAKDVIRMILEKFEVIDVEGVLGYFGLYESKDGSSIDGCLPADERVAPIVNSWKDDGAKLVFMIRLFMPCLWGLEPRDVVAARAGKPKKLLSLEAFLELAQVADPNLIHLQYLQAVYHVITGQYPTSQDLALTLGALHFFFKFGDYVPTKHRTGFLGNRIVEFIPVRLLKKKSLDEWEALLYNAVKEQSLSGASTNPQRRYMEFIYRLPNHWYGSTFFRCTQDGTKLLPDTLIVGIHALGIFLYDKSSERTLIRQFRIEEILRWGYKPNVLFYFEIKGVDGIGPVVEFKTGDGQKISDLLTDYALAFLKEREKEDARAESLKQYMGAGSAANEHDLAMKDLARSLPEAAPKQGKLSKYTLILTPEEKRNRAATRLQALFRGYSLRSQWIREDAAIRLQAAYRGYKGRVRVFQLIEEMMASGQM